jgi:hypothetical protein
VKAIAPTPPSEIDFGGVNKINFGRSGKQRRVPTAQEQGEPGKAVACKLANVQPTPSTGPPILTADSACTVTYVSLSCPVLNKRLTRNPIKIKIPNGATIESTHITEIDRPMLRPTARKAHIVPALDNCSLLSLGQLCDPGCSILPEANTLSMLDAGEAILPGSRDHSTGMWHIILPSASSTHMSHHVGKQSTANLAAFAHATLFSPSLSTLEKAPNNGYLTNFPGLNAQSLRKVPPASVPMAKGHLDQTRKNQRSTRQGTHIEPDRDDPINGTDDFTPPVDTTKTFECYCAITEPTGQIYTDQTGRFISPSSTSNNYLMILYDYDSIHIFAQPMKNQQGPTIVEAYAILDKRL